MEPVSLSLNSLRPISPASGGAMIRPETPVEGGGFGKMLGGMVKEVDGMQKAADAAMEEVVSGKVTDVHQVSVKMQEAGVAFDLMLGVRNRLMDAYNELIKMQA